MNSHAIQVDSNDPGRRELELSDQLAKILRKPPKCHKHELAYAHKQRAESPDNEPDVEEATESLSGLLEQEATAANDKDTQQDPEVVIVDVPLKRTNPSDLRNATVVKTTRRARFRNGARQVSSWIITLGVTGFITGCVAVIVLGVPQKIGATNWLTSQVSNREATTPPKTTKVNTVRVKITPAAK